MSHLLKLESRKPMLITDGPIWITKVTIRNYKGKVRIFDGDPPPLHKRLADRLLNRKDDDRRKLLEFTSAIRTESVWGLATLDIEPWAAIDIDPDIRPVNAEESKPARLVTRTAHIELAPPRRRAKLEIEYIHIHSWPDKVRNDCEGCATTRNNGLGWRWKRVAIGTRAVWMRK